MRRGRDARGRAGRHAAWFRVTAAASSATLLGTLGLAGTSMAATGAAASAAKPAAATAGTSCHLGNGVKHVVTIMFDNVHYFRDNPNVPSDLQQMPNLLKFFTKNGTFLSNNHTPLIAHTADDILTTFTGLYGDRHGMPISNSYQAYNAKRHAPIPRARSRTGPTPSSTPRRRRAPGTTPTRTWSTRRCRRPPRGTPWRRTRSPRRPGCR